MTNLPRLLIVQAIVEAESWIARACALIEPDEDSSSITESVTRAQHEIARLQAKLATVK